ncbi:FAS-associated factor 1 [Papilio machaon]|uniref:FAS-associated factor 1 n=1 Tax=Papilio machaon TaxID=76193 RepID=A0A0N1IQR1_PAPMA|nr:FAS-associated factor 1 [Papilio machaon]
MLGLQRNAVIRLKSANQQMADDEVAERLTTTYVLRVKHDEKEYTLKYPGTKTVQEVKNDIYSLTDVPVRHQVSSPFTSVFFYDS